MGITVHPLERVDKAQVERYLAEMTSRLGAADEVVEDVYSDRVRQDSEYRWRRGEVLHVLGIAHYSDSDSFGLYEERRLER